MYYEINVAKDHKHFFATAKRSLTTKREAEATYKVFLEKFPKEQGYSVSCTLYETVGQTVVFE